MSEFVPVFLMILNLFSLARIIVESDRTLTRFYTQDRVFWCFASIEKATAPFQKHTRTHAKRKKAT